VCRCGPGHGTTTAAKAAGRNATTPPARLPSLVSVPGAGCIATTTSRSLTAPNSACLPVPDGHFWAQFHHLPRYLFRRAVHGVADGKGELFEIVCPTPRELGLGRDADGAVVGMRGRPNQLTLPWPGCCATLPCPHRSAGHQYRGTAGGSRGPADDRGHYLACFVRRYLRSARVIARRPTAVAAGTISVAATRRPARPMTGTPHRFVSCCGARK
jgi:hypothetical protein